MLSNVCAYASNSTAINGRAFGGEPLSALALSNAYGVHLTPMGPTNEGSLRFTPPRTGDYTVFVGTPRVGVAVFDPLHRQRRAVCSTYIDETLATKLTGAACPALRAAFTFFRLEAGVSYALELGPIAPQEWVRTIIVPTTDSDGDGLSDAVDLCPQQAATTYCGCGECAKVEQVVAGEQHTCALRDGAVRCWGRGALGRLGYDNEETIGDDETPAVAGDVPIGGRVVQLAGGFNHTCALLDRGAVRCWGSNFYGALGYGNRKDIGDTETPASAGDVKIGGTVASVAAGYFRTCAVLDTGSLRCWGENDSGELGYGHTDWIGDDESPASAGDVAVGGRVVQVALGGSHVCALLDTGSVRCWGRNDFGMLGYGNTLDIGDNELPASAGDVNVGARVVQIVAGSLFTCALLESGAVRCWGYNWAGQLGYGNTETIGDDEVPASAGDVDVGGRAVQLVAGYAHACALLESGAVRCWGDNSSGELGYGHRRSIGDDESPASAGDVDVGGRVVRLGSAGRNHTCAILERGTVRCWGLGFWNALGYVNSDNVGDDESPASVGDVDVF